ncbi:hypothetical protein Droror1_Dr00000002 [Drosera rotundifolia]
MVELIYEIWCAMVLCAERRKVAGIALKAWIEASADDIRRAQEVRTLHQCFGISNSSRMSCAIHMRWKDCESGLIFEEVFAFPRRWSFYLVCVITRPRSVGQQCHWFDLKPS